MSRHLLVIGAQRSGSTLLSTLLDSHPEIAMCRPMRPEPKVFCSAEATRRGLDWYERTWFAHARPDQLLGDKSTSYLEDRDAPARAAAMLGSAEVVAVLRDPVRRAVSNWAFTTQNGFEDRPLEVALQECLGASRPWDPALSSVSPYAYLERGRYVDQLPPWLERFPETTRVVFLTDLLTDGRALSELFADLGVAPFAAPAPPDPVNASAVPSPPLSEELEGALREYFAPADARLAAILDRQVPWATR